MSPLLIALASTAAIVLTWFFCLRPMRAEPGPAPTRAAPRHRNGLMS